MFYLTARKTVYTALGISAFGTLMCQAQETLPTANSGDTAWLLSATALVLFMTMPGLALFYGGLVRAMLLGKRRGFPDHPHQPHNPGMVFVGAAMLWVVWSAVATVVIALTVKATLGLRVSEEQEYEGMDQSEHGENAYPNEA